jgi:flagellar biosynthesis protein FlhG
MPVLLPIASGKGGVGKSVISANLAFQLAKLGKTVILADMDWGGANAHTIIGIKNSHSGIGDFANDKTIKLADLVVPLPDPHFFFLPGDGLIPGTANMSYFRKSRLIKELKALTADIVILDLGAGTHYNTVDLFLACQLGFIVTSPEPTAILNAYSFIKTALFRLLQANLPSKHPGRPLIYDFFCRHQEQLPNGSGGIEKLFNAIAALDADAAGKLRRLHGDFCPRIMVNMGKEIQELALGGRLRQVCTRHLSVGIDYIAFVPWDEAVRPSIIDRQLLGRSAPEAPFVKSMVAIARKIAGTNFEALKAPINDYADLQQLAEEFELS